MKSADLRKAMVDNQIRPADVTGYGILAAFLSTLREAFVPEELNGLAYAEAELAISEERKMMTPRSLAKLVAAADPKPDEDVLLIGAGLGYEAAILAQLANSVIAVENDRKLAKCAEKALNAHGYDNAIVVGGKLTQGDKKAGPFDLIVFSGAVEEIPQGLFAQLKPRGRIVAYVVEARVTTARLFTKEAGSHASRALFDAAAPVLPGFEKKTEFVF